MSKIKNPIFIKNCTDPTNGKIVNCIYFYKKYRPNKYKDEIRTKRDLVWQYYRNRWNKSIEQVFIDYYNTSNIYEARIIYKDESYKLFTK